METPLNILRKYWKHDQFRPLQEDIVNSVLKHQDTLALLPTGGGKSVCFQVPALVMDGICIVVTPLIALMNDQVAQLKSKGIEATSIHSGLKFREIDLYLDNCIHGKIKFLYVSPERLKTEIFIERLKQMNVCVIAVDEAHCISQWGYDFRPPYLEIAAVREILPDTPVIALTATATKDVQDDIVEKLAFETPFQVFSKSFARENLSFIVRKSENKEKKLLEIVQKVKGSAIVYVRSRKGAHELSDLLNRNNIKSGYYHAGLDAEDRNRTQQDWITDKCRVIVATNAFGMGIDKSDVRIVIHFDLPENMESYYQEAGRAGRDSVRSYAAILYNDSDVVSLRSKIERSFPSAAYIGKVYQALSNYYQLAIGSAEFESYDFDLTVFAERFHFNVGEVYTAMKKMEEEALIQFNESYYSPSQLTILVDAVRLYEFQIANAKFEALLKMILRLYGGELYAGFVKISEPYLAKAVKQPLQEVLAALEHLDELQIIIYKPTKDHPQITFLTPRQDADKLPLNHARMTARKELVISKMDSLISFVTSSHICRMRFIQEYFGEDPLDDCHICDVCVAKRKKDNEKESKTTRGEVLVLLAHDTLSIEDLEEKIAPPNHELFLDVIREMVEDNELEYDDVWRLRTPKSIRKT